MNTAIRKTWGFLMALILFAGALAGCSSSAPSQEDGEFADAQALLMSAWEAWADDEKPTIIGGVTGEVSDELPLALDLNEKETIEGALNVPAELIDASSSGASMMNAMMANSFTASAWQLKDPASAAKLAAAAGDQLEKTHWLCGSPEGYQIVSASDYLVVVYGLDSQVSPFVKALSSVCPSSKVIEKGTIE